jgi:D-3-phosphoglycerate dehydrogenase
MSKFLFIRSTNLETRWPFVPERVVCRLQEIGEVVVVNNDDQSPISVQMDLSDIDGVIFWDGGPQLTDACIEAAPRLKMVGAVADNAGMGLPVEALFTRDISIIDGTRGWAQSVAELGLGLALSALRRVPWWHQRMRSEAPETVWQYEADQYCDDSRFVNGTLGSKQVGVVGLGQIGRRVAAWCDALGATVGGYDPFISKEAVRACGASPSDLDTLVDTVDLLFITVPPTPSADKIVSRDRVYRLRNGAIVVVVTRAHGIDMTALRERIYADELIGAFDVYDLEPLPADDLLLGRDNVLHVPHIAGRTKDANVQAVDIIVDDFARILRGETPQARVTREVLDVRLNRQKTPG